MRVFFKDYDIGKFPDGRMELKVRFEDKQKTEYVWTPKWDDLQYIFLLAYTVERLNHGAHFKPLVEVAKEVYTHHKEYIENPKQGYDKWGFTEK